MNVHKKRNNKLKAPESYIQTINDMNKYVKLIIKDKIKKETKLNENIINQIVRKTVEIQPNEIQKNK